MQSLHHITIAAYYVDGLPADPVGHKRADRKTAIGIYAADKPFSKGGKLTLRASIPARLNGYKMPSLKEARDILTGKTLISAFLDLPLPELGESIADYLAGDSYALNITTSRRGHCTATVRINGNVRFKQGKFSGPQGARFAAEQFIAEHKATYPKGEQYAARAAAPATLSTDESAPRSDSAVVNMLLAQRVAAAAAPAVADLDRAMIDALPPKEEGRADLPALPHDIVTAHVLRRLLQGHGFNVGALAALPGRYFVSQHGKFSGDYGSEAEAWQAVIALADSQL